MRNLPRFALVPLAALFSAIPLVALPSTAGADTVADCEDAFSTATQSLLTYTTNPPARLAYTGQTVSLEAGWDPAAWDSLSSAVACVRLDDDSFDEALGISQEAPANAGAFGHSFTVPEGLDPGTRLCTRIRLAGDPAGDETEAVWVTRMHCFEVDHDLEEAPPDETAPAADQPPGSTTTTAPVAAPATSEAGASDTPAAAPPAAAEGDGSPVGTPFDSAAPSVPSAPLPAGPKTPEALPMLPATGYASLQLLHRGEAMVVLGLGLLALGGRRRRQIAASPAGD
jgi:hypothetical protein